MSAQEKAEHGKRYEVQDATTGDCFGNHDYASACSRARVMNRNWLYKKVFLVRERRQDDES